MTAWIAIAATVFSALGPQQGATLRALEPANVLTRKGPTTAGTLTPLQVTSGLSLGDSLASLTFLPVDFVGRTQRDALDSSRPRYRDDVPGASRIQLPGQGSMLYRYQRRGPEGLLYGWLTVDRAGRSRRHGESPGSGLDQSVDPWMPRVAVGPGGRSLLVASTRESGGDLYLVHLDLGQTQCLTNGVPPATWSPTGLALSNDWGLAVNETGVYRFQRTSGPATLRPVPVAGPAPAFFTGDAVLSENGRVALTTAGSGPQALHPFVLRSTGPMRQVTADPSPIARAGFLPDDPYGPYLAVANGGRRAAWRTEGVTREVVLARVLASPASPGAPLTADGVFPDTMDETGLIGFLNDGRLTMGVGGLNDTPREGIEGMDVFAARVSDSGVTRIENLSRSSGEATAPFASIPTVDAELYMTLPGIGVLIHDGDGERLLGLRFDAPGLTVLLADVKEVVFVEPTGDALLVAVRRDFDPRPFELHRLDRSLAATAVRLVAASPDSTFANALAGPSGWVGFTRDDLGVGQRTSRIHVPTGLLEVFPLTSGRLRPPLGFRPDGTTLVAMTSGATTAFTAWQPGPSGVRLLEVAPFGHFVPGP